jgi:nucleotide-binding universal stress UspA family protein
MHPIHPSEDPLVTPRRSTSPSRSASSWSQGGSSLDLTSLLVAHDLGPAADRVLRRVALLPFSAKARVTLLHVVPDSLPTRGRGMARRDAAEMLQKAATALAAELPDGVTVRCAVETGAVASAVAERAEQLQSELLVVGRGGGRGAREFFLGSTAERVIRAARVPVLAVRGTARAPYRQPAMAVDNDHATSVLLPALLRVLPTPAVEVGVIHAYDVPFGGLLYPSLSTDDSGEVQDQYRRAARERVREHLAEALEEAQLPSALAPHWRMHVRVGSPRTVIARAVRQDAVDLLALGTRARRGLKVAFVGSVAGDMLRQLPCDVLMVPPG